MTSDFNRRSRESKSFRLVADWTLALNEREELADVLNRLMRQVKADAAMITRMLVSESSTKYVVRCDVSSGKVWPTQPRSCAETLIGDSLFTARVGSIWKLSDIRSSDYGDGPQIGEGVCGRLKEVVMCPLENEGGHTDILELQYLHQPLQHDLDLLAMLVETLSIGWRRRVPGFVAKTLNRKRKYGVTSADGARDVPLLGVENPAHLSRCEFRVCSLLKEGMTVNVIAKTLRIGPATVRSHLSSVFAKTGTANQVELLHELNREIVAAGKVATG